jgi:hypothetical protein
MNTVLIGTEQAFGLNRGLKEKITHATAVAAEYGWHSVFSLDIKKVETAQPSP